MTKPKIGIIEWPYKDQDGDYIYEVLSPIIESVARSGGIPVGIFPSQIVNYQDTRLSDIPDLTEGEKDDILYSINNCDAVLKPGATKIYGYERFIYDYVLNENIPYLGICAGMQLMAAHGKQRIENVKIESNINHKVSDTSYAHEITLLDSKLKEIINKDKILVSSRHLYRVPDSGVHKVSAMAPDGVIEAIENDNCDFNIGVQWHPELLKNDINSKRLFDHFIDAAQSYKIKKLK